MTAATLGTTPITHPARPSLVTLTLVELRKMTDTRAGRWLLIVVGLSMVALLPVVYFGIKAGERTPQETLGVTQAGVALLLPVVGILSVTGEWSQRSVMTTFSLVPVRERIAAAKMLAGALLGVAAFVLGVLVAAAGQGLGHAIGRADGGLLPGPSLLGGYAVYAMFALLSGVAFGMLWMNSPLAIVLYFIIPTVWATLGESVGWLKTPAEWLDTSKSLAPLTEHGITDGEWEKIAASLAVWLLLPLAAGTIRLARREVK